MRRILCGLLIWVSVTGLCACGQTDDNTEEVPADMSEEISQMEENAVGENESVSIPTTMDENGELTDYVNVSVVDTYVETEKITEASLDLLQDVTGAFIDDKGNLIDGYSFIGVKLNINSEKDLNINTASSFSGVLTMTNILMRVVSIRTVKEQVATFTRVESPRYRRGQQRLQ